MNKALINQATMEYAILVYFILIGGLVSYNLHIMGTFKYVDLISIWITCATICIITWMNDKHSLEENALW